MKAICNRKGMTVILLSILVGTRAIPSFKIYPKLNCGGICQLSDKYVISPHVFDSIQHSMSATHGDHGAEENFDQGSSVPHELLILYATETGTARETADRIARECRRVRFQCRVQSMDAYPPVCNFLDQRSVMLKFPCRKRWFRNTWSFLLFRPLDGVLNPEPWLHCGICYCGLISQMIYLRTCFSVCSVSETPLMRSFVGRQRSYRGGCRV